MTGKGKAAVDSETASFEDNAPSTPSSEAIDEVEPSLMPPQVDGFCELIQVDREAIVAEQASDATRRDLRDYVGEGLAEKQNVALKQRVGIIYRQHRDYKSVHYDQLVVSQNYLANLLKLCHGSGWSGHLGIKKTGPTLKGILLARVL